MNIATKNEKQTTSAEVITIDSIKECIENFDFNDLDDNEKAILDECCCAA